MYVVPEIHDVILMVSPIQGDRVGVQEHGHEKDNDDLHRLRPSVHEIPIENVWIFCGRVAILNGATTPDVRTRRDNCSDRNQKQAL